MSVLIFEASLPLVLVAVAIAVTLVCWEMNK